MIQRLVFILAGLGAAGLLAACLMTLLDVVLRHFGISVLWLSEFVLLLITASVAAFFPLSLHSGGQLTIPYIGNAIGGAGKRALNWFGALATLIFFVLIGWRFVLYAIDTLRSGETTPMAALPIYPAWILAAAILVAAALIQLIRLLRPDAEASAKMSAEADAADGDAR